MNDIIINEWKNLIRDRLFSYSTIFFVLSLSLVVWMGVLQQENQKQSQSDAQKHVRKQWENLPINSGSFWEWALSKYGNEIN